jgi:hypothetical protein
VAQEQSLEGVCTIGLRNGLKVRTVNTYFEKRSKLATMDQGQRSQRSEDISCDFFVKFLTPGWSKPIFLEKVRCQIDRSQVVARFLKFSSRPNGEFQDNHETTISN